VHGVYISTQYIYWITLFFTIQIYILFSNKNIDNLKSNVNKICKQKNPNILRLTVSESHSNQSLVKLIILVKIVFKIPNAI